VNISLLLEIIGLAASAAKPLLGGNATAETIDAAASALVAIAQKASQAHQEIVGQPIDLSLLKPIEPLEDPKP